MRPLLAHQGGWDELLLAATLVVLMLLASRWRRGREARSEGTGSAAGPARIAPVPDTCAYCGVSLEPDAARCGSCGFRVAG